MPMAILQDVLTDYQTRIDLALDRIQKLESREMTVSDTFRPFKDWTSEAIAIEQQIIGSLQGGIETLRRRIDAPRP
jgi:hypothetical protein